MTEYNEAHLLCRRQAGRQGSQAASTVRFLFIVPVVMIQYNEAHLLCRHSAGRGAARRPNKICGRRRAPRQFWRRTRRSLKPRQPPQPGASRHYRVWRPGGRQPTSGRCSRRMRSLVHPLHKRLPARPPYSPRVPPISPLLPRGVPRCPPTAIVGRTSRNPQSLFQ